MARLVRGQILSLKEKELASRPRGSIGTPTWRIMLVHTRCPTALAPIIVSATFAIPGFIITEADPELHRHRRATAASHVGRDGAGRLRNINAAPHLVWTRRPASPS